MNHKEAQNEQETLETMQRADSLIRKLLVSTIALSARLLGQEVGADEWDRMLRLEPNELTQEALIAAAALQLRMHTEALEEMRRVNQVGPPSRRYMGNGGGDGHDGFGS